MPILSIDAGPSRKTRITRVVKSGWCVLEDGAVDSSDKSIVVEIVDGAGSSGDDVGNSLRKIGIPTKAEVRCQPGFQFPGIGHIGIQIQLVGLMLVGLPLEKRRQSSRQEIRHAHAGHCTGKRQLAAVGETGLFNHSAV